MMPPLNLELACKELRGGFRQLKLFIACLMLGVAVMACIGSLIESVKASIDQDAASILGGDIEIRQVFKPLSQDKLDYVARAGALSRTQDTNTMIEAKGKRVLVELKAVDEEYPLYGDFLTTPHLSYKEMFERSPTTQHYGVLLEPVLMDALRVTTGDTITLNDIIYDVRGMITQEPDRSLSVFTLGLRVMMSIEAFNDSGLLQPGSIINYRYRVQLPPSVDVVAWQEQFKAHFGQAGSLNFRDRRDSSPMFSSLLDRLSLFFSLTGLTTLLTGGIGISNAVQSYLLARRKSIATLKCLGARNSRIYSIYLIQLIIPAIFSIILGLLLGVACQMALEHVLQEFLPLHIRASIYVSPLLIAAAFGIITTLLFSVLPLYRTSLISPVALFRDSTSLQQAELLHLPLQLQLRLALIMLPLIAAMIMLAVLFTNNEKIVLYFAIGTLAAFSIFTGISQLLKRFSRNMARKPLSSMALTMAYANLSRAGSATYSIIIALGISATLLVALTLVGSNLRSQLATTLPEKAPAFFLVDVLPDKVDELQKSLSSIKGVGEIMSTPMLRGKILKINGVEAREENVQPDARWALRGDRRITWSVEQPRNAKLVRGEWWAADYKGAPLISFDARLARGMGVGIGDTITYLAQDSEVTATIYNLREINWGTLEMNFASILSQGAVPADAATYLVSVVANEKAQWPVQSLLSEHFPEVSVVRVQDALLKMVDLLDHVSIAVLATASITIFCAILVMASALNASLQRRVHDTVVLKVVGIRKSMLLRILLLELILIALSVAGAALIIGSIAAYGIMQLMIFSQFSLFPTILLGTIMASISVAIIMGLLNIQHMLNIRPLALLRNE